jgi:hypothetical protein
MQCLPSDVQRDIVEQFLTTPERAVLRERGPIARGWVLDERIVPKDVWRLRRAVRAWWRKTLQRRPRRRRASWARRTRHPDEHVIMG